MALPDADVARVQRWCTARVPDHARHQIRVECQLAAGQLTIVERRAPWRGDPDADWSSLPTARLRYTATDQTWTLYWRDRNLRFHRYDRIPPSAQVDDLLDELDRDPTHIFWGYAPPITAAPTSDKRDARQHGGAHGPQPGRRMSEGKRPQSLTPPGERRHRSQPAAGDRTGEVAGQHDAELIRNRAVSWSIAYQQTFANGPRSDRALTGFPDCPHDPVRFS